MATDDVKIIAINVQVPEPGHGVFTEVTYPKEALEGSDATINMAVVNDGVGEGIFRTVISAFSNGDVIRSDPQTVKSGESYTFTSSFIMPGVVQNLTLAVDREN